MNDSKATPPPMIGQELIAELRDSRDLKGEPARRERRVRRQILDLHLAGAVPEPGPLVLTIRPFLRQHATKEGLARVLGEAEAEAVWQQLPTVTTDRVCLDAASAAGTGDAASTRLGGAPGWPPGGPDDPWAHTA